MLELQFVLGDDYNLAWCTGLGCGKKITENSSTKYQIVPDDCKIS